MKTVTFRWSLVCVLVMFGAIAALSHAFPTIDFNQDFNDLIEPGFKGIDVNNLAFGRLPSILEPVDLFGMRDGLFDPKIPLPYYSSPIPDFHFHADNDKTPEPAGPSCSAQEITDVMTFPSDFQMMLSVDAKEKVLSYLTKTGLIVNKSFEIEIDAPKGQNKVVCRFKLRDLSKEELDKLIKKYEDEAEELEKFLQKGKLKARTV
jgi:hypothetical protein